MAIAEAGRELRGLRSISEFLIRFFLSDISRIDFPLRVDSSTNDGRFSDKQAARLDAAFRQARFRLERNSRNQFLLV